MARIYFKIIRPMVGVALCAGSAAASVKLFGAKADGAWLPVMFIAIAFLIAVRFGALVGILGSIAAALVFAYALFPPIGKLAVEDAAARGNIGWMLLGGIVISFLVAPGVRQRHGR